MPAANAVGIDSMPAMTAQASAFSNRSGPTDPPVLKPRDGCVRIAVKAERMPASVHANVDMRDEKMPAMRAASGLAAAPRMPSPKREGLKNRARRMASTGASTRIPEYAWVMRSEPNVNTGRPGGCGYAAPFCALELIDDA